MYFESLWNHVVIQQGIFNRFKITYYVASSIKIHEVSDFSNSQFVEKMQKQIHKLPKRFTNCELRMVNSNPESVAPFKQVILPCGSDN